MRRRFGPFYNCPMGTRVRHAVARGPDEPVADLTEHDVVHRGMRVDLERLARAVRDLSPTSRISDTGRRQGLREHLAAITALVDSHCWVESDVLEPLLAGLVGSPSPVPIADAAPLTSSLREAEVIATALGDGRPDRRRASDLALVLDRAAEVATAFTGEQERVVHPLIRRYVRAGDYRWVRDRFLTDLPPGLLAFVVPWTLRHAAESERSRLLDHRDPALCVTNKIFVQRFAALETVAFGVGRQRNLPHRRYPRGAGPAQSRPVPLNAVILVCCSSAPTTSRRRRRPDA